MDSVLYMEGINVTMFKISRRAHPFEIPKNNYAKKLMTLRTSFITSSKNIQEYLNEWAVVSCY